jgi:hypothetical protein
MSTVSVSNLKNAASATNNLVLNPDGSVNISGGTLSPQTGFKNRIINGAMTIDQRNAGAAVTAAGYCVDRWSAIPAGSGVYTQQQLTDAPAGFINSLRVTNTTAATPTAGQFTFVRQIIEGFNIADLGWGTASAQAVTVSFWVKASITGTYSLFALNSAEDRSYVGTFTVSASNTWEFKTVTIPGDTTGTWLTNNSNGIRFGFDLGSGSDYQGTANAWNAGWKQRTSGTVNFSQTAGATFQVSGVQLEKGSVATPFEFRSIGTELGLCERYCIDTSASVAGVTTTSAAITAYQFIVAMRASPTFSWVSGGLVVDGFAGTSVTAGNLIAATANGARVDFTATGLQAGRGAVVVDPRVRFTSEL